MPPIYKQLHSGPTTVESYSSSFPSNDTPDCGRTDVIVIPRQSSALASANSNHNFKRARAFF